MPSVCDSAVTNVGPLSFNAQLYDVKMNNSLAMSKTKPYNMFNRIQTVIYVVVISCSVFLQLYSLLYGIVMSHREYNIFSYTNIVAK